jgi:hypothetical protein
MTRVSELAIFYFRRSRSLAPFRVPSGRGDQCGVSRSGPLRPTGKVFVRFRLLQLVTAPSWVCVCGRAGEPRPSRQSSQWESAVALPFRIPFGAEQRTAEYRRRRLAKPGLFTSAIYSDAVRDRIPLASQFLWNSLPEKGKKRCCRHFIQRAFMRASQL